MILWQPHECEITLLIAYEQKYDYKHHCYSGSLPLDCLLPDLTLLTGAAMFKDTESMM